MGLSDRLGRLEKAAAEREYARLVSFVHHVFDGVHPAILRVADEPTFDRFNSSYMAKYAAFCDSSESAPCVTLAQVVDYALPLMQEAIYEHIEDPEFRTLAVDGVRQAFADALAMLTGAAQ